jgi:iron complex outermembrane recepter protein
VTVRARCGVRRRLRGQRAAEHRLAEDLGYRHQGDLRTEIGDLGTLNFNFLGTYLDELELECRSPSPVSPDVECVGLYGNLCGTPNPEWRHQARLGFDFRNGIGTSVRWRYFDAVVFDGLNANTQPGIRGFDAVNYFDLALTFDAGDNFNFRLGANNVFDKAPPVTGSQACPAGPCNGNVFAQVYDALGRYIYAGVTLDF